MNVMPTISKDAAAMKQPRARIGLIIPSVNTYSEPQFNHFAPDGLGIHVARARVAGQWKRPLPEMKDEIAGAAKLLSDAHPDVIVFHCTDTSMTQGPQGEGKILDIVKDATGIDAMATSRLVLEALQTLGMKKVVLLTPYKSNKAVIDYLTAAGVTVVARRRAEARGQEFRQRHAAGMGAARQGERPARRRRHFLSCTNTTADRGDRRHREDARQAGGQQQPGGAVGRVKRLRAQARPAAPMPELGRLMASLNA